jgi:DNA helicase HerA-like ATPase
LLEPPGRKASKGEILIGDIKYNRKKLQSLYLKKEDFLKQVGIFAITGEDKTNLAYLLALQLVKSKTPFMVIDWKRSWRNFLSLENKHPELKSVQVLTVGRDILPFFMECIQSTPRHRQRGLDCINFRCS